MPFSLWSITVYHKIWEKITILCFSVRFLDFNGIIYFHLFGMVPHCRNQSWGVTVGLSGRASCTRPYHTTPGGTCSMVRIGSSLSPSLSKSFHYQIIKMNFLLCDLSVLTLTMVTVFPDALIKGLSALWAVWTNHASQQQTLLKKLSVVKVQWPSSQLCPWTHIINSLQRNLLAVKASWWCTNILLNDWFCFSRQEKSACFSPGVNQ